MRAQPRTLQFVAISSAFASGPGGQGGHRPLDLRGVSSISPHTPPPDEVLYRAPAPARSPQHMSRVCAGPASSTPHLLSSRWHRLDEVRVDSGRPRHDAGPEISPSQDWRSPSACVTSSPSSLVAAARSGALPRRKVNEQEDLVSHDRRPQRSGVPWSDNQHTRKLTPAQAPPCAGRRLMRFPASADSCQM